MQLFTERLTLRDFVEEDLPALHAYRSDRRYQEFYEPSDVSLNQTADFIALMIQQAHDVPRLNFQLAVTLPTSTNEIIGNCGIRRAGFDDGVGQFGFEFAPWTWGQGLATEAALAIGRLAFDELGLRSVVAESVTENDRVNRLAKRLGIKAVRVRVGPEWMRPRGWSETEWRITAEDWARVTGLDNSRVQRTPIAQTRSGTADAQGRCADQRWR